MPKKAILLLIVNIASFSLFGQYMINLNKFEPEIFDARAGALGRASIFSSTGANYLFNNPALLSLLKKKNIQLSCRIVCGKDKIESKFSNSTSSVEFKYPFHTKINGLSGGFPFSKTDNQNFKFGLDLGYRTYYDWGYNEYFEFKNNNNDYDYNKKYHGGFNTIVLGSGLNYQNKYFMGLTINFQVLSNFSSEYKNNQGVEYDSDGSMNGKFVTASSSYKFQNLLFIGARYRSGISLKVEEEDADGNKSNENVKIPYELGFAIEISNS